MHVHSGQAGINVDDAREVLQALVQQDAARDRLAMARKANNEDKLTAVRWWLCVCIGAIVCMVVVWCIDGCVRVLCVCALVVVCVHWCRCVH